MAQKDIVGRGFAFPFGLDASGSTAVSTEEANIRQSMMVILGTAPGERIMRPTFGCAIHDILFEPNTAMTASKIEYEVKKSLQEFEPRIAEIEVHAAPDEDEPSRMNVTVAYTIRRTCARANFVYPFYLRREGE